MQEMRFFMFGLGICEVEQVPNGAEFDLVNHISHCAVFIRIFSLSNRIQGVRD